MTIKWRIQAFEQLDSTQEWLCRRAEELPEGTCVTARLQTSGRGRQQRGWESAPGGLYLSFLLKPQQLLPELPWVLWWAALETLEQASSLELTLKAPNDLLSGGRKLAGMLIDSRILGQRPLYYVCGLGINLNQQAFGAELASSAVSLARLTGRNWRAEPILEDLLKRFEAAYELLLANRLEGAILAALGRRQVQIGYNGREFKLFEEYWHGRAQGDV